MRLPSLPSRSPKDNADRRRRRIKRLVTTGCEVPREWHTALDTIARAKNISKSTIMRLLIADLLQENTWALPSDTELEVELRPYTTCGRRTNG